MVLWLYLFVMVPRMNRALSRTRHPRGKKTERRLERCAPAVVRRMERKQQWCSAVESILEVAFERHSAMVSLLYMMGVQTSTNAAFASVLYSVVAAAVLCTYRAGGEDFKYNVKVSLNFPLDRPTNMFFLTSLWDRTAATARTRARQGPGQEEAAKRKRLRPQGKRKRLPPQGKRKRLRPRGKRKRLPPQGKRKRLHPQAERGE